ncbi:hypothetical protein M4578_12525, partial [Salipiger sp. P9]|uniref:CARDB domain-containing protein n=1 Tax=Salipiger pentaromativorans TaxID=2943193 RepID=UPI00237C89D3
MADFVISSVSMPDPTIFSGERLSGIRNTITNNDGFSTPASETGMYLSTDANVTTADTFIGYLPVRALGAYETYDDLYAWNSLTVNLAPGTYYFALIADDQNTVAELNESNNTSSVIQITILPDGPDMTFDDFSIPSTTINAASVLNTSWTVANEGNQNGVGTYDVDVYISPDGVIDGTGNDVLLSTLNATAIAEGATDSNSMGVFIPSGYYGTYYIGAVVDLPGDVDGRNNVSEIIEVLIIPTEPELIARDLTLSETTFTVGDTITFNWTTENLGQGTAVNFDAGVYISTDPTVTTADTLVKYINEADLSGFGTNANSTSELITTSMVSPGTYYVAVIADDINEVTEANEGNNVSNVVQVVVAERPDLTISIGSPESLTMGQGGNGQVLFSVTNDASGGAASATETQLYLSSDNVPSPDDTPLGSGATPVAALAPGASGAGTLEFTIPEALTPGQYYLWAGADINDAEIESDENNNSSNLIAINVVLGAQDVNDDDGSNTLEGSQFDDVFQGNGGDDTIDGGDESLADRAVYTGERSDFAISVGSDGTVYVEDLNLADGDEGSDQLSGIEEIVFADQTVLTADLAALSFAETGTLSLSHVAQTVTLSHSYTNPVVVAFVTTENGTAPVNVRVSNISGDQLTLFL